MNASDPRFLDHALAIACEAAGAAAEVIRAHYRQSLSVRLKEDRTPVTEVDEAAERSIREVLQREFPEHAIYGEEQGHTGDSDWLWLVDPLDGTKSYVRGQPMFSTQIALMHCGDLLLGVSSAPLFDEMAWARSGGGAFLNGQPIRASSAAHIDEASLSAGNLKSLAAGPRWDALGGVIREAERFRGYGDFFHYHLLARGALDGVVESDVNILDVAALAVIVREAGGRFTDLDGRELDLETRSVCAASSSMLHDALLARFAGWH